MACRSRLEREQGRSFSGLNELILAACAEIQLVLGFDELPSPFRDPRGGDTRS